MYTENEIKIINEAAAIFESKIKKTDSFTTPDAVKQFCMNKIAHYERETFLVLFLDNQHRLIEAVELFHGTIDSASVYPREVAKYALKVNSAAVILSHNHPSGTNEPSIADRKITSRIADALNLLDIRTLDHIVVSCEGAHSFAEHGQI